MKLEAQLREKSGKSAAHKLRQNAMVPGIVYGGSEHYKITLSEKQLRHFIQTRRASKKTFEIEINTGDGTLVKTVVLQDYQKAIIKDNIVHADFREVTPDTMLEINISLRFVGQPQAVKLGGVLQVIRHSIPVKSRAADVVDYIEIDVTELNFGESVHVLDVTFPKGIKPVITGRNFTLMTISGTNKADEAEETETETGEKPEDKETAGKEPADKK